MNLDEYGLRQKNTAALFPNVSTKYSLISSKSQILSINMFSKVPKITISIFIIHNEQNKACLLSSIFSIRTAILGIPLLQSSLGKEWFHQKICSIGAISYFFGTKNDMEKDKFGRKFLHTLNLTSVWIKPNYIKSFENVSVGSVFSRSYPSRPNHRLHMSFSLLVFTQ